MKLAASIALENTGEVNDPISMSLHFYRITKGCCWWYVKEEVLCHNVVNGQNKSMGWSKKDVTPVR